MVRTVLPMASPASDAASGTNGDRVLPTPYTVRRSASRTAAPCAARAWAWAHWGVGGGGTTVVSGGDAVVELREGVVELGEEARVDDVRAGPCAERVRSQVAAAGAELQV